MTQFSTWPIHRIPVTRDAIYTDEVEVQAADGGVSVRVPALSIGAVQTAMVALPTHTLLDLFTTPVELVAAPGAGKVLVPVSVVFHSIYRGTPFTTAAAVLYVTYTAAAALSQYLVSMVPAQVFNSSGSSFTLAQSVQELDVVQTLAENQPLILGIDDTLTVGNGAARVYIYYLTLTL